MPTNTRRATSPVAAVMEYLLPRDRLLLQLLDVHFVLTTGQVTTLLGFGSLRRCQDRLRRLHQLGLLERWRHRDGYGGSQPWRWTLGPVGMQLQAAAAGQSPPSPRRVRDRLAALVTSPDLTHRIGVNQFFTDLVAHGRTHPETGLVRWWPEQKAASLVQQTVVPDGHGLWHADGITCAWFLEWDSGAEELPRLVAKIAGYEKAARSGGPAWPVLLYLHSPVREDNLHQLLAGALGRCPVATAARTPGSPGPAGAVWRLLGGAGRLPLHRLAGQVDTPAAADWADDYTTGG